MELIKLEQCDACKAKNIKGFVACSAFGAQSFAYCQECLAKGREPYQVMVDYIASAGHWPEDINPIYQREVRRQLKLHDIPEEVFKFDVERAIQEELAFIREYCAGKLDLQEVTSNGVEDLFS